MIFLVQFGINKKALVNFFVFEKIQLLVLIYSKLHSKSCDYRTKQVYSRRKA